MFASVDACLTGLAGAYPDADQRGRVCEALHKRTARGDEAHGVVVEHAAWDGRASVLRGPGWVLIRDVVGTKAGVNDNGQWKTPEAIREGWQSFDGVPVVYGHPDTPSRLVEDHSAVAGYAVNTRLREADLAIVRDVLLFTEAPEGYRTSPGDLMRNKRLAQLAEQGVPVHVSEGYLTRDRAEAGTAPGQDGKPRAYREVQEKLRGDHLAILSPLVAKPGACPFPICGVGADAVTTENPSDPAALELAAAGGKWGVFTDTLRRLLRGEVRAAVDECAKNHLTRTDAGGNGDGLNDMDEKQVAAIAVKAAADEASKVRDELKAIRDSLGGLPQLVQTVEGLKGMMDERNNADKAAADAALVEQAGKVARLRVGLDAAKVKAEAERLKGLGKAALDELEQVLAQPGRVDPTLLRGPVNEADPFAVSGDDGATYVRDWSKVQLPSQPFSKAVGK